MAKPKSKSGDTVGKKFGMLLVKEVAGKNNHHKTLILCECDCGKECTVIEARVRNGSTASCGCRVGVVARERFFKDMTGQKIGRLTFIKEVKKDGKGGYWECLCECGNTTITTGTLIRVGHTTSCGCYKWEQIMAAVTSHGQSSNPTYFLWNTMHARCYYEKSNSYPNYGGRGIGVCERWHHFPNFYEDMGDRPEGLSLERVDVNKDYSPENCIWDTPSNQAYNQRLKKNNKSGRSGVSSCEGKWRARIWKDKVCYDLGLFNTFEEACEARELAEIELYGFSKI